MSWKTLQLAELALPAGGSFVDGPFGSNLKASEYVDEGVPIIRLQNVRPNEFLSKDIKFIKAEKAAELSRHSYAPGDLVISKLGDPPGYACVVPQLAGSGVIVADVVRFRGDPKLADHRYLSHYLNSADGRRQFLGLSRGSTRTRVNLSSIKTITIPVPGTLDEQKRIAAVLDRADALRRQRQDSLQLTEKLLQSLFLDMFVKNPEAASWEVRSVEWMAKDAKGSIRTGPFGSQLLHSEFVNQGIAVLGIDNAVKNRFEWGQLRFITPKKYGDLRRYKVFPGDLIITIMGTLGRCAIVPNDIPEAINTKHLCCITLDQKKCLPEFLHAAFLNHPDVLRQLGVRTKGAVMPGLNMGIIKDLKLPMPPLELQKTFSQIIAAITASRINFEASLELSNKLFSSLQQRAFRGELDLSRMLLDEEIIQVAEDLHHLVHRVLPAAMRTPHSTPAWVAPRTVERALKKIDITVRQGVPIPWSADYFRYRILATQPTPFSFSDLMQKAESVFEESPPYETIRDMIFDLLGQDGKPVLLRQRFDISKIKAEIKDTDSGGNRTVPRGSDKELVFEPVP